MKTMSLNLNDTVQRLLSALQESRREQRRYRAQLNAEEAKKIRTRKMSDTKKVKIPL
jgi:hypothetical protein